MINNEIEKDENGFIKIEIKKLIEWDKPYGEGCIASNKITKEGYKVGYMYREKPVNDEVDSGWRFFSGNEDRNYSDDPNNFNIFSINTICNYDKDIIPYLDSKIGDSYIRINSNKFKIDDNTEEIFIEKQF